MFVAIMYSVSCRHTTGKDGTSVSEVRKNATIGLILAVTFGLGWIFGLLGTSSLPIAVSLPSVYLFTILVGTQGLLTFVLRVLRSHDVRNEWKKWFYALTCRKDSFPKSSHQNPNLRHMQGSSSDTVRRGRPHTSTFRPGSTSLTSESSDTLRSRGHHSDTMHRAIQLHQLESVTEEVESIIEEPPATIPQVRKLTVIENRHIADDLESGAALVTSQLESIIEEPPAAIPQVRKLTVIENRQITDDLESGTPVLVTSQLEPSVPLSPALTQELQPIRQKTENLQVDCGEDSPDNTADTWSEWIEGDAEVTETIFINFSAETKL